MNTYAKSLLIDGIIALELAGSGDLHRDNQAELVALGIRYRSSAIMGRSLTGADRKRFSLVAGRLERAKLIRRVRALDGRTTHYTLATDGIDAGVAAIRADGSEPDHAALNRGIDLIRESWKIEHHHPKEGTTTNERSPKTHKPLTRPATSTGRRRRRAA